MPASWSFAAVAHPDRELRPIVATRIATDLQPARDTMSRLQCSATTEEVVDVISAKRLVYLTAAAIAIAIGASAAIATTASASAAVIRFSYSDPPPTTILERTLCVGGPHCYATVQAALNAAHDGDTVRVGAGTFAGGITITRSVNLVGVAAA